MRTGVYLQYLYHFCLLWLWPFARLTPANTPSRYLETGPLAIQTLGVLSPATRTYHPVLDVL
jgi:hypothetical protein